jgi:penicillin amidase
LKQLEYFANRTIGNPFSAHYSDQAALYNAGKFRRMLLNKDEIVRTSTKLLFIPSKIDCL